MVNTRGAIRSLWADLFSVFERQETIKANGAVGYAEALVIDSEPCKLSYSRVTAVEQGDMLATLQVAVKLFCSPELVIKPGSKIRVEHCGRVYDFVQSGEPGIYSQHQEVPLAPFEKYA